ncbi:MAG: hypothetical protein JXK05_10985 [Campylobacterales bacterium]|nr:hypothetical protein [Campylobacterales bacterium]
MKFWSVSLLGTALWAASPFVVGVGGYDLCYAQGRYTHFIPATCKGERRNIGDALGAELPNVNAVAMWITSDWQEQWYPVEEINQKLRIKGYLPVFMVYYFADAISPKRIREDALAYRHYLERFVAYLRRIDGEKVVILHPEFNQNGVESDPYFNDFLLQSLSLIRQDAKAKVGFCVGDFGHYEQSEDPYNFTAFHRSIEHAVEAFDFIAFQEMRALTRNTRAAIKHTPQRSLAFATYLHQRYRKPTFLAYAAISSYGDEALQAEVYQGYARLVQQMKQEANLIGLITFHLYDVKGHVGYFKEAESYFGLIDSQGSKKKSVSFFQTIR